MLLTKYAPTVSKDIVGNSRAINETRGWLANWSKGHGLLVYGPAGTGKTAAIRLIAKESGYELLEVHADEKIPAKELVQAGAQRSIFSKKKMILIENIETASMRGFSELLKQSGNPVVCTTADAYRVNPTTRKMFKLIKFDKVGEQDMVSFAKRVLDAESVIMDERKIMQLARIANGDVRAMLIDMEAVLLGTEVKDVGYRNFEENVFNTIKLIFKTMSMSNAKIAAENCEKDADELFAWLEQNIYEEYTDPEAIARAYDYLSKADVFASRIMRRQAWNLQKYSSDLTIYGTALAKTRPSIRAVIYRPPAFQRRMSRTVIGKIASSLHTSVANVREYVPLIKIISKRNPEFLEKMGLDEREADSVIS